MSVIDLARLSEQVEIARSRLTRAAVPPVSMPWSRRYTLNDGSNADVVAKQASAAGALLRRLLETLPHILPVAGIALAARSSC
jgi:hypothetical protein